MKRTDIIIEPYKQIKINYNVVRKGDQKKDEFFSILLCIGNDINPVTSEEYVLKRPTNRRCRHSFFIHLKFTFFYNLVL